MKMKITSSDLATKRYLICDDNGVEFYESAFVGGTRRRFAFAQIDCILFSPSGLLSLQVGREVFSLTIKPADAKHQQLIETMVNNVRNAHGGLGVINALR